MVNAASTYFTIERTMSFILQPWQFFIVVLVGWVHREQQKIIEFYQTQVETLMKAQGKKRLLLNDDQRRLLAVKGKSLGRKALMELTTIVTPDTIMRWHRKLVAEKWDHSERRKSVGRPRVQQEIVDLVLRFAKENPTWGYDRIQGALANVGYHICDQTVGNILKEHGIEPADDRKRQTTWSTFIKSHWDVLAAIDFTTVEVWTTSGLVTYYLLFVMEVATRRVHLAACTRSLGDDFMKQIARNLTDPFDGFLRDKKYVLMDRDSNFSAAFRAVLKDAGVEPVRLPARSPNLNAHLERFHLSIKSECLSRMIFFGEKMLRNALRQYLEHYHGERNHQSLNNELIDPDDNVGRIAGKIQCRDRLGGLLNYYYPDAA
jgi:transposase InsO family protein